MFNLSEQAQELNISAWAHSALTAVSNRGVAVHEIQRTTGSGRTGHLDVELRAIGLKRRYVTVEQPNAQLSTLSALNRLPGRHKLLLTQHVTPGLADTCRNLDIHFADSSGNIFLNWGKLLIDVEGRRTKQEFADGPSLQPLRAFQRRGLTVVFALLCTPRRVATYRELSRLSGASLGTVHAVIKELSGLGFVELGEGRPRLHQTRALFDRWADAYVNVLGPTLELARYSIDDPARVARTTQTASSQELLWGGETAATILDDHLVPASVTIYSQNPPVSLLSTWRARPAVNAAANVFVRRKFWSSLDGPSPTITPAPLIYADLIASGDPRQIDAAARLRERDDLLKDLDSR